MARDGLFQRDGSRCWQLRYAGPGGKIVRESSGTTSKKLAREILAKKKALVAEGRHLDVKKRPRTTFYQLCDEYWELWGKHKRTKGLRGALDRVREDFGDISLRDLEQKRIEAFLGRVKDKGRSDATRNRYLALIKGMLNKALEWGMADRNPAAPIKPLKENNLRTRFLEVDEIQLLLEACSDDLRPILITALHTGMRRSEIFGLRWQHIDLRNRMITIPHSKPNKTRFIPLDETLRKTLSGLTSRFQRGLVFPSPKTGEKRTDAKHAFRYAVKKAGLEDVRFHDLRHTCASHLVMSGADIKVVQEILGHHSLVMTQRYSHLAKDHRTRAIRNLDRALHCVEGSDTKSDTVASSGESGFR